MVGNALLFLGSVSVLFLRSYFFFSREKYCRTFLKRLLVPVEYETSRYNSSSVLEDHSSGWAHVMKIKPLLSTAEIFCSSHNLEEKLGRSLACTYLFFCEQELEGDWAVAVDWALSKWSGSVIQKTSLDVCSWPWGYLKDWGICSLTVVTNSLTYKFFLLLFFSIWNWKLLTALIFFLFLLTTDG